MTTLITGGTGLIGACMAEKLLARDERVVLLDLAPAEWRIRHLRQPTAAPKAGGGSAERGGEALTVVRGDVTSLVDLMAAVRDHAPSAIVHLAYVLGAESNQNPELATRVNILGTTNVLEAARLGGVPRVLLASSIAVYGADSQYPPEQRPLREDAALHVAWGAAIYGGGKVYLEHLGRHYARRYGLVVAGLRPSIVYGWGRERGASAFAGELVDAAATGQPVTVRFGDARVSLVYVEDVADEFVALLDADPERFRRHRFFNTGGDTCTVREMVDVVRRLIPGAKIDVQSAGEVDLAGLAASVSDKTLEEELGFRRRFTPLEVGIRAHIEVARSRKPPLADPR